MFHFDVTWQYFILQEEAKKSSEKPSDDGSSKKKVTKRKPSSDKLSKDEVKESVPEAVPAETSGIIAPKVGDDSSEFTVKVPSASKESTPAIPAEASGIVETKASDEETFTARIPSVPPEEPKKKKVTTRKKSEKIEPAVPGEASSMIPLSQVWYSLIV